VLYHLAFVFVSVHNFSVFAPLLNDDVHTNAKKDTVFLYNIDLGLPHFLQLHTATGDTMQTYKDMIHRFPARYGIQGIVDSPFHSGRNESSHFVKVLGSHLVLAPGHVERLPQPLLQFLAARGMQA